MSTAVYLLNRSSCKAIGGRTPYELWNGHMPSIQHLRTFGCIAHTKVNTPHQKKVDDRSRRMVFVGYEPGSKAYRVYDPSMRRVHISRDIVFDEAAQWTWSAEHDVDPGEFIIQEFNPQEPAVIITTSTMTTCIPAAGSTSGSSSAAPSSSSSPPVMDRSMANAPASGSAFTTPSPQLQ